MHKKMSIIIIQEFYDLQIYQSEDKKQYNNRLCVWGF